MHRRDFERLVAAAVDDIPERFRGLLRNVAVVIADEPSADQLRDCSVPRGETMYAYYEGVAQIDRSVEEPLFPDRIVVFQQPLEEDFGDDAHVLQHEVARTIRHEMAHHFGIEDDRLEELGKY